MGKKRLRQNFAAVEKEEGLTVSRALMGSQKTDSQRKRQIQKKAPKKKPLLFNLA